MKMVKVGNRTIGAGQPCFIVAEVGINHNGDMALARAMIDAAVAAGADSVKFQNYRTDDFLADRSLSHTYVSQGREVTESQYDMFKRYELTPAALMECKRHCDRCGVIFHSTPTSEEGIRELVALDSLVLKNGSDFLGHLPLIQCMARTGIPSVLATGMATLAEIDDAVRAFWAAGGHELILLHCTSAYPTPPDQVHLRKMHTLAEAFGCPVGFSDHTEGVEAAIGAVALGACWIEKHFTLDHGLSGPDHSFSLDPSEFKELVKAVRCVERELGCGPIGPTVAEEVGRRNFRLSCVAAHDLACGQLLTRTDIAFMRPGIGFPPKHASWFIGQRLKYKVNKGEVLLLKQFTEENM